MVNYHIVYRNGIHRQDKFWVHEQFFNDTYVGA